MFLIYLQKSVTETNLDQLLYLQNQLKMGGKIHPARAKWIEDGGKPSTYLCFLESNIYVNTVENGSKMQGEMIY